MLCRFSVSLLLALIPAAHGQGFDRDGQYWSCQASGILGEGADALQASYSQDFALTGAPSQADYFVHGGVKARWTIVPTGSRVIYLDVDVPSERDPSGVYAYLYGDGRLVAKRELLSPNSYRRGGASSYRIGFNGPDIEAGLDRHDRWTLVIRTGADAEILRRVLPVPDQRTRLQAFARGRAAVAGAWKARDQKLLETADPATLPPGPRCLLSTPATREELSRQGDIEELPVPPRIKSPPAEPVLTRP